MELILVILGIIAIIALLRQWEKVRLLIARRSHHPVALRIGEQHGKGAELAWKAARVAMRCGTTSPDGTTVCYTDDSLVIRCECAVSVTVTVAEQVVLEAAINADSRPEGLAKSYHPGSWEQRLDNLFRDRRRAARETIGAQPRKG